MAVTSREFAITQIAPDGEERIIGDAALHEDMLRNLEADELEREKTIERLKDNDQMTTNEIKSLYKTG